MSLYVSAKRKVGTHFTHYKQPCPCSYFQANLPTTYWVEALNMTAHLLNIISSSAINNEIPFTRLFNKPVFMIIFVFLVVFAIQISYQLPPTNSHRVPLNAFFLVILAIIVATNVSIFPLVESFYLVMWFLMKRLSLFSLRHRTLRFLIKYLPPSRIHYYLILSILPFMQLLPLF